MRSAFLSSFFALVGCHGLHVGAMGLDAITRIVGFFVSAMGVALIFDGVIEALGSHGVTGLCIELRQSQNVRL